MSAPYKILEERPREKYETIAAAITGAKRWARAAGSKAHVINSAGDIEAMVRWDGHVTRYDAKGFPMTPNASAHKYVVYIHAYGRKRPGATRPPPLFGRAVECKTLKQCDEVAKQEMKDIEKAGEADTATVRITRHTMPDNPRHARAIETLEQYEYWDEWERTK